MSALNYSATKCDEETPYEPGSYRLEDIRRTSPMTHDELLKRKEEICREEIAQAIQEDQDDLDERILYQCPPVAFQLSPADTARLATINHHELRIICMRSFTIEMLGDEFTHEQRIEIAQKIRQMSPDKCSIRCFSAEKQQQKKYYTNLMHSIVTKTPVKENISRKPFITFCVTFPGYEHPRAVPGQAVAIFYTASKCKSQRLSTPIESETDIHSEVEEQVHAEIRREVEEQVRAEIRREMEEKMRVELEVQKQLAEQKQKELEEQKELKALHAHIRKVDILDRFGTERLSKYDTLVASGHTLLIGFTGGNIPGLTMVTNKGVFIDINSTLDIHPLYKFTKPLDMKQSNMILQLSAATWNCKLTDLIQNTANCYYGPKRSDHCQMDHKKFESVIRLIPGSYFNGAWKQLDGFFGAYINEETMEIMGGPPPI